MRKSCILVAALLLSCAARAQVQSPAPENGERTPPTLEQCGNSGNTFQIMQCLKGATEIWDRRLNAAYREALKLTEGRQREQLLTAQRAWIAYRDANCLYYGLGPGTIASIEAGDCMRSMTETRALELEAMGPR